MRISPFPFGIKMFPRNAATCKKCFQVFCCKNHRKNHERNCCSKGLTRNSQINPTAERKQCSRLLRQKAAAERETVCSSHGRKRKMDCNKLVRPISVATALHDLVSPRKILTAIRKKSVMMVPSLPSLKEEDEEHVEEQESKTFAMDSSKIARKILGGAYNDFKRGSLSASPIALPDVPVGLFSSPTDSESSPLPQYGATSSVEAAETPLTFQIPRPPHKALPTGVFKTSTPKDNEQIQETEGANDEQISTLLRPHTSEPATREINRPVNCNQETSPVNAVSPFIPLTPMTSQALPVRQWNLMEGVETGSASQLEEQPGPSLMHAGRTFTVGESHRSPSFSTPFTGSKKNVSWASDTFETVTSYYSARSHFSFGLSPGTPLPNPSLFTTVKDAFKNLVSRMPGTSIKESPAIKRLKLVAEAKIQCRPTYKGRYPKPRTYLIFNDG